MEANCIPWNPFVAAIHDRREDSPQKQVNTILIVEEHPVVYYQFQQRSLSQFPVSFSPSGAAVARACEEQP
jgi:hypothetical protein